MRFSSYKIIYFIQEIRKILGIFFELDLQRGECITEVIFIAEKKEGNRLRG